MSEVSLLDLPPVGDTTTFSYITQDKSMPLLADGRASYKWLWAHAISSQLYNVPEAATAFNAIGFHHNEPGSRQLGNSFRFLVYVDGDEAFASKPLSKSGNEIAINVPLPKDAKTIELFVDPLGDLNLDMAIWADPRFVFSNNPTPSTAGK